MSARIEFIREYLVLELTDKKSIKTIIVMALDHGGLAEKISDSLSHNQNTN